MDAQSFEVPVRSWSYQPSLPQRFLRCLGNHLDGICSTSEIEPLTAQDSRSEVLVQTILQPAAAS
ncbi:hypothetical protein [Streptomyces sp. NBC_01451]|uniref:hypothetical protein n=1 Tax=Streptomyces sp. NBC_01451 TaxID=2903872 RepID=UPI002E348134|nr:hypothetical protein [Streptomyces sp. NBC_01451]